MKTPLLCTAVLALALVACVSKEQEQREPPAKTPPVLAGVPVVPGSEVIDTAGTWDAARITLRVAQPPESVVAYYRRELPKASFRIVGDLSDGPGTDLYAQRDGPALWVQVRPASQPGATQYSIIGAVGGVTGRGDSARPDTARRGAPR